jgi:hypothetical protein
MIKMSLNKKKCRSMGSLLPTLICFSTSQSGGFRNILSVELIS